MIAFNLNIKTKVYFGTNIIKDSLEKENDNIKGNILIVTTGGSLIKYGYLQELVDILCCNKKVTNVLIYEKISKNPKLKEVKDAIYYGITNNIQMVIGFGGGSAIDAAKAIAVGIGSHNDVEEYLFKGLIPSKETLPIIAIPTTAGTGSELSKGAIITCSDNLIKTGIRGENILPKIAIVDAKYTLTVPISVSMETGFDVLAHAIESYVSRKANLFSEMLSENAIKIVSEYLPIIKNKPDDILAREKLCYASMIMGLNLANVGTCLPHRMQYPIGAITDTSHAAGLIGLYSVWIKYEYDVNHEKINSVLKLMKKNSASCSQEVQCYFIEFLDQIGTNYKLRQLGIDISMIPVLCDKITGSIENDKLHKEKDIIRKIYEESI